MQICCWNLAKVLKHQTAQFYSVCMLPILVVYVMYLFGHFEILKLLKNSLFLPTIKYM